MSTIPRLQAVSKGRLTIVAYFHYFLPGSLKYHTKLEVVPQPAVLPEAASGPPGGQLLPGSRRSFDILPDGESPYPGYCRSPTSFKCLPALCNCAQLWNIWQHTSDLPVDIDLSKRKPKPDPKEVEGNENESV